MNELIHILRKVGIEDSAAFDIVKDLENGLTIELLRANAKQRELLLQIEDPYQITEHENNLQIKKVVKM